MLSLRQKIDKTHFVLRACSFLLFYKICAGLCSTPLRENSTIWYAEEEFNPFTSDPGPSRSIVYAQLDWKKKSKKRSPPVRSCSQKTEYAQLRYPSSQTISQNLGARLEALSLASPTLPASSPAIPVEGIAADSGGFCDVFNDHAINFRPTLPKDNNACGNLPCEVQKCIQNPQAIYEPITPLNTMFSRCYNPQEFWQELKKQSDKCECDRIDESNYPTSKRKNRKKKRTPWLQGLRKNSEYRTLDTLGKDNTSEPIRTCVCSHLGQSVPSRKNCEWIKGHLQGDTEVLSLCTDQGLWEKALKESGVTVTSTNEMVRDWSTHVHVKKMSPSQAVQNHPDVQTLFTHYPSNDFDPKNIGFHGKLWISVNKSQQKRLYSKWDELDQNNDVETHAPHPPGKISIYQNIFR
jgi:hypothetical protein